MSQVDIDEIQQGIEDLDFENPGFEPLPEFKEEPGESKPKFTLMPHQVEALAWMVEREKDPYFKAGLLGMLMGLGKTFTSLKLIEQNKANGPTLVVCPKTALYTWEEQIQKFYGNKLKVLVFRKDRCRMDNVTKGMLSGYDIVLTNYDFVRSLNTKYQLQKKIQITVSKGESEVVVGMNVPIQPLMDSEFGEGLLFSMKWCRIISDESHNFSNRKTALWTTMMCLCGGFRWCLTGTPIRNYDDDVYNQFKWLGFKDKAFNPSAFRKLNLAKFIHFVDYNKANVVLPDVSHNKLFVKLDQQQQNIYDYYFKKAREAFEDWTLGCKNFASVLVQFLRLRQVCVAPYIITPIAKRDCRMTEEERREYLQAQEDLAADMEDSSMVEYMHTKETSSGIQAAKILKTVEIIRAVPSGEKVVVFTMFPRAIDLLTEALGDTKTHVYIDGTVVGKERDATLTKFKQTNIDVLFISYKVGSESLNLTEANHVILLEPWWSHAVLEQAKSRVNRMGQTKNISIYEMFIRTDFREGIAEKDRELSMEEKILLVCEKKKKLADEFLAKGGAGKEGGEGVNAELLRDILF